MTYFMDVGVVLVIILTIIIDYKKGLAKSVLGIVSNVASILGATYLGSYLSNLIYDNIIKDKIIASVTESVNTSVDSTSSALKETTVQMPNVLNYIMSLFGYNSDKMNSELSKTVETQSNSVANGVEAVVGPLVTALLTFFLIILLFIIFRFILSRLSKLICRVMRLPVIGSVNRLLGGVFGILNGLIIVYFLSALMGILIPVVTSGGVTYSEFNKIAEETVLFNIFYDNNVILKIFDFIPEMFS